MDMPYVMFICQPTYVSDLPMNKGGDDLRCPCGACQARTAIAEIIVEINGANARKRSSIRSDDPRVIPDVARSLTANDGDNRLLYTHQAGSTIFPFILRFTTSPTYLPINTTGPSHFASLVNSNNLNIIAQHIATTSPWIP